MKKLIAIALTVGLLAAPMAASAEPGWSTAGKILTGVIGLHILGNALAYPYGYGPAYAAPPPSYYYPPREQVWVPGHYSSRYQRQWVPGYWTVENARRHGGYDDEDDDGYRDGGRRAWVPGHYEDARIEVWVPGHWEERG